MQKIVVKVSLFLVVSRKISTFRLRHAFRQNDSYPIFFDDKVKLKNSIFVVDCVFVRTIPK